jgi:hypothetical protein
MYTITPIIRPEHYVLPVKHPPNCRCTQHGSRPTGQAALTPGQRAMVLNHSLSRFDLSV